MFMLRHDRHHVQIVIRFAMRRKQSCALMPPMPPQAAVLSRPPTTSCPGQHRHMWIRCAGIWRMPVNGSNCSRSHPSSSRRQRSPLPGQLAVSFSAPVKDRPMRADGSHSVVRSIRRVVRISWHAAQRSFKNIRRSSHSSGISLVQLSMEMVVPLVH